MPICPKCNCEVPHLPCPHCKIEIIKNSEWIDGKEYDSVDTPILPKFMRKNKYMKKFKQPSGTEKTLKRMWKIQSMMVKHKVI